VRINDIAGPDLLVQVNTGGTLAADMQIRLTGTNLASMTASDFFQICDRLTNLSAPEH
jgi:hypothetical protein